ncbi:spore germination protein [Brevibacillus centrosporus]|uniref:spore germination protein n=1 Tax=Brevibacillus centrosporus TaxID=54910 RepID=UPI003D25B87C
MKNPRFQKVKGVSPAVSGPKDPTEIDELSLFAFKDLFDECYDVVIEEDVLLPSAPGIRLHLLYSSCLCDLDNISEYLMPQLTELFSTMPIQTAEDLEEHHLFFMTKLTSPTNIDLIVRQVFSGNLLLFFENLQAVYYIETGSAPKREPEEPNSDVSIRGPRDGFTEEVSTNLALIRKRLKTYQLKYVPYIIGTHTHTCVGLLYLKDQIDPLLLEEIKDKIDSLHSKGIISGLQAEEQLSSTPFTLLPEYQYTGRPDYVCTALLKGRFAVLIDGSPSALVGPVNFSMLLNAAEDTNTSVFTVVFVRIIRMVSVVMALFLPGFWVALVTYHHDQLPYTLIATIIMSRQGVPLPAALEVLLMVLLFDLFKEAGLRLPLAIGQTLSVVGGLIVGQAAISAGLTSSGSLVIVALSVMATFTLTNQHVVGTISILRIIILLICSLLGMFGYMMALLGTVLYFVNKRSFGLYYLSPITPTYWSDLLRMLFRTPWRKVESRPQMLDNPARNEVQE